MTALLLSLIPQEHTELHNWPGSLQSPPHHHPEKRQEGSDPDRRGFPHSCASVGLYKRPKRFPALGSLGLGGKVVEKDFGLCPSCPGSRAIQAPSSEDGAF